MTNQQSEKRQSLRKDIHTLVIKVGTKMIVNEDGTPSHTKFNQLVSNLCDLRSAGIHVVLVTSGAVGMGMPILGFDTRPKVLAEKQACAAVGQILLMHLYAEKFQKYGQSVAQVLLSGEDFRNRERFFNIRRTLQALFDRGVIPIINENDTISTEEIKVGDNDKLSSDVAHFLEADLLILLSDEKGLYDKNPKLHADAKLLSIVEKVTPAIEKLGGGAGSVRSVGGMRAKLRAIKQATEAGTPVLLTNDSKTSFFSLLDGAMTGTLFLPNPQKLTGQLRWLAFVAQSKGSIRLDAGGVKAMQASSSSLLAIGISAVTGSFNAGDIVEIADGRGKPIGRGKVSYSAAEVKRIQGKKSNEIAAITGRKGPGEVIHRDHLVIYR